jgi:hypothetical protein
VKKEKFIIANLIIITVIGLFSSNLSAQNKQNYKMDNIGAKHYITISREEIDKNNLPLAKVYAKKAIQANSWNKEAWANYDDIVQKLADDGEIQPYETFLEKSKANSAPSAGGGGSKFEGC